MRILCLAFQSNGLSRLSGHSGRTIGFNRLDCEISHLMLKSDVIILTRRPETSEYFLAGLKDGGASILKSKKKKEKKKGDQITFKLS